MTATIALEVAGGTDVDLSRHYDAVVVIDVIRAMTTACVLLAQGASELVLAGSMDELRSKSTAEVLVADLDRETALPVAPGERQVLPNSPAVLATHAIAGKRVAMCTQNGTRALLDAPSCDTLLGAATVNLSATVERIRASGARTVLVIPSDRDSTEDLTCLRHFAAGLSGRTIEPSLVSSDVRAGAEVHRRTWGHLVTAEAWRNFEADVSICSGVDTMPFALEAVRDSTGQLRLRRGGALQ